MSIFSVVDRFYHNLQTYTQPGDSPSIVSCLRSLEGLDLGGSTAIQKLAKVVKAATENSESSKGVTGSGSAEDLARWKEQAQAIADSVVNSHLFGEIEREDRDVFLRASSKNPHNFFMRFLELGRMAWNRIRYKHGQSKENQNDLCILAARTLQTVVETLSGKKIEEKNLSNAVADEFINTFGEGNSIPGQKEFEKAFVKTLREVPSQTYQQWIDAIQAKKAFEEKKRDLIERANRVPGNKALLSQLDTAIADGDLIDLEERIRRREKLLWLKNKGNDVQELVANYAFAHLENRWDEPGAEDVILSISKEEASLQESVRKLLEIQTSVRALGEGIPNKLQKRHADLVEQLNRLSSLKQDITFAEFSSNLTSRAVEAERALDEYLAELNALVTETFKEFDAEKEALRKKASEVEAEATKLGLKIPSPRPTDAIDEKVTERAELEKTHRKNVPRIAAWMNRWRNDFGLLRQKVEDLSQQVSARTASIERGKQREAEEQRRIEERKRTEEAKPKEGVPPAEEKRLAKAPAAKELPQRPGRQVEPTAKLPPKNPIAAPAPKLVAPPARGPQKPAPAQKTVAVPTRRPVATPPAQSPPEQPIPVERFRKTFGANADLIHGYVMSLLPQMAHRAKATGQTQKESKWGLVPFEVKYRLVDGQPQITISQNLGKGTYKTIKKVLLVAGPAISACGDLFAYGKLILRTARQDVEEMEEEIRISQLLNERVLPGENSNIIRYYRITHRRKPSLKGVHIELCTGDAFEVTKNIALYTLKERLMIARDAANGLSRMNAAGLCHLDFKPGNLLIKREAPGKVTALVADFGLTEQIGKETSGGTLCYMPPSILKKTQTRASPDIDSWSLGLLIFELLAGQSENPLFPTHLPPKYFEVAYMKMQGSRWDTQYWLLTEKVSRMSPPFNDLISGLLNLNPETRWSAAQARDVLDNYIKGM